MRVYYDFWQVAERLRIRDEYLLEHEQDESKKDVLRQKIQSNTREANECRRKYLDSISARRRDWEYGRLIEEGYQIRQQAIEEAKEILAKKEKEGN